jgi:hypothetical protein
VCSRAMSLRTPHSHIRSGRSPLTTRRRLGMAPLIGLLLAAPVDVSAFDLFRNEEATIADIHAAFRARTLTCRGLVQMYLDRIEAYDKKGPDARRPPPASSGSASQSTRCPVSWVFQTAIRGARMRETEILDSGAANG